MLKVLRHFDSRIYQQALPYHFRFSQLKQKINDDEQRAIFSYMVLKCILDSSKDHNRTQTIRGKIHQQAYIKDILFDIAKKQTNRQEKIQNLEQIGMNTNLLKQTLAAFDINDGFQADLVTFNQARFTNALSPNGKMVLFPTVGTGKIIQTLLSRSQRIVVSGGKGTGKSFSYLTYSHITEPLISLRLNAANGKGKISEQFYRYVPKKQFQRIRKLFYIPISKMQTTAQFISFLKFQCPLDVDFSPKDKDKDKEKDELKQVTSRITQYYFNKRILSVCVLDQSNSYFSQFRKMLIGQNQDLSRLKFYSSNLESIGSSFYLLLYNSSQSFQSNMIKNWNKANPNNPYNNPYMHQRNQGSDLRLRFSQNFDQITKHLELYNIFWEELCKYYPQMRLKQNNFARKCFQDTFCIPKEGGQVQDTNCFVLWALDVRHLNIRNVLQNKINSGQLLQNTKNQNNSHLLSKQFLSLKNQIVSQRESEIMMTLQSYYAKAINNQDKIVRYAILSEIRSTALQQNISEDKLCFSTINLDHILKKYNQKYQKNFKNQIIYFTQLIGSGYNIADNICRLPITIKIIRFITNLTDSKFSQVTQLISAYFLQGALTPILAGNFLDMLHFFLFQEYKNMRLIIKHNQKQKLRQYYVANILPFQVRSLQKMYLPQQLKKVLEEADKYSNIQKWVLAHQATIFKNESDNINGEKGNKDNENGSKQDNNYQLNSLNPIFDYVLVKRQKNTNKRQYAIHSYDLTIGSIDKKVSQMKYLALCQQIKNFYKYQKIRVNWSHFIIGTLENVTKYISRNRTGTYQIMFMDNYVSKFKHLNQEQVQEIVCTLELGLAAGFQKDAYLNNFDGKSSHCLILFHQTVTQIIKQLDRVKMYTQKQDEEENQIAEQENKNNEQVNKELPVQEINRILSNSKKSQQYKKKLSDSLSKTQEQQLKLFKEYLQMAKLKISMRNK